MMLVRVDLVICYDFIKVLEEELVILRVEFFCERRVTCLECEWYVHFWYGLVRLDG